MTKKRGLPPNSSRVPYPAYTPGQHLQQNEVPAQEGTFYQQSEQPATGSEEPQFHAEEEVSFNNAGYGYYLDEQPGMQGVQMTSIVDEVRGLAPRAENRARVIGVHPEPQSLGLDLPGSHLQPLQRQTPLCFLGNLSTTPDATMGRCHEDSVQRQPKSTEDQPTSTRDEVRALAPRVENRARVIGVHPEPQSLGLDPLGSHLQPLQRQPVRDG